MFDKFRWALIKALVGKDPCGINLRIYLDDSPVIQAPANGYFSNVHIIGVKGEGLANSSNIMVLVA